MSDTTALAIAILTMLLVITAQKVIAGRVSYLPRFYFPVEIVVA